MGRTLAVILALISLTLIASSCGGSNVPTLYPSEVREYQGQRLDSIGNFRENSIKGPQYIDITTYQLKITGLVQTPKSYTYQQVLDGFQSYKKVVTLDCVEGWSVKLLWEGILLKELLAASSPTPEANTVIFHADDGYTTSLPLDYIINNNILMADKMNDIPIPPERGYPFMLVAESKWGYKWAKWIVQIELSNDPNYRGYWESRGYSNQGDLNKGFFESGAGDILR